MINAGNPSVANLQMRKYVKEHKESSAQIFEMMIESVYYHTKFYGLF